MGRPPYFMSVSVRVRVFVCLRVSQHSWGQPFYPPLSGECVSVCAFQRLRRDYFS